jgi:hypothetical protein
MTGLSVAGCPDASGRDVENNELNLLNNDTNNTRHGRM